LLVRRLAEALAGAGLTLARRGVRGERKHGAMGSDQRPEWDGVAMALVRSPACLDDLFSTCWAPVRRPVPAPAAQAGAGGADGAGGAGPVTAKGGKTTVRLQANGGRTTRGHP
jgi:hypothetical protein